MPGKRHIAAYAQIFLEALERMVVVPDRLTRTSFRVWLLLVARSEWGGIVTLSQTEAASILSIKPSEVSQACKVLVSEGLLYQEGKRGRLWTYRLPTALIHRGRLAQVPYLQERERRQRQATWQAVSAPHGD